MKITLNFRILLILIKTVINLSIINIVLFLILLPLSILITINFYNLLIPYDHTVIGLDVQYPNSQLRNDIGVKVNYGDLMTVVFDDLFTSYGSRKTKTKINNALDKRRESKRNSWDYLFVDLNLFNYEMFALNLESFEMSANLVLQPMFTTNGAHYSILESRCTILPKGEKLKWVETIESYNLFDLNELELSNLRYQYLKNNKNYSYQHISYLSVKNTNANINTNTNVMASIQNEKDHFQSRSLVPPIMTPFIPPFITSVLNLDTISKFIRFILGSDKTWFEQIGISSIGGNNNKNNDKDLISVVPIIPMMKVTNDQIFNSKVSQRLIRELSNLDMHIILGSAQNKFVFNKLSIDQDCAVDSAYDIALVFKFKYSGFRYYLSNYKYTAIASFTLFFWIMSITWFLSFAGIIWYGLNSLTKSGSGKAK